MSNHRLGAASTNSQPRPALEKLPGCWLADGGSAVGVSFTTGCLERKGDLSWHVSAE
jgi:hypothetical protein